MTAIVPTYTQYSTNLGYAGEGLTAASSVSYLDGTLVLCGPQSASGIGVVYYGDDGVARAAFCNNTPNVPSGPDFNITAIPQGLRDFITSVNQIVTNEIGRSQGINFPEFNISRVGEFIYFALSLRSMGINANYTNFTIHFTDWTNRQLFSESFQYYTRKVYFTGNINLADGSSASFKADNDYVSCKSSTNIYNNLSQARDTIIHNDGRVLFIDGTRRGPVGSFAVVPPNTDPMTARDFYVDTINMSCLDGSVFDEGHSQLPNYYIACKTPGYPLTFRTSIIIEKPIAGWDFNIYAHTNAGPYTIRAVSDTGLSAQRICTMLGDIQYDVIGQHAFYEPPSGNYTASFRITQPFTPRPMDIVNYGTNVTDRMAWDMGSSIGLESVSQYISQMPDGSVAFARASTFGETAPVILTSNTGSSVTLALWGLYPTNEVWRDNSGINTVTVNHDYNPLNTALVNENNYGSFFMYFPPILVDGLGIMTGVAIDTTTYPSYASGIRFGGITLIDRSAALIASVGTFDTSHYGPYLIAAKMTPNGLQVAQRGTNMFIQTYMISPGHTSVKNYQVNSMTVGGKTVNPFNHLIGSALRGGVN